MATNDPKRNGAGAAASGVLQRLATNPPTTADDPVDPIDASDDAEPGQGPSKRSTGRKRASAASAAPRKVKGRTVYIPEDLFERIIVGAHRRGKTISEYIVAILERQVPDHRTRADPSEGE